MSDVIKKDGSRQAFSEEKVKRSIEAAARDAKIPDQRIPHLVDEAAREAVNLSQGTSPVETRIIRGKVLRWLDATEPAASAAWRAFDVKTKKE
jgi:transcriptional regulator NrdR family protein